MTEIEYQTESFLFAPDVQGPMSSHALELINAAKPDVTMVGGPPFYLGGFKVDEAQLQQGLKNLTSLAETVPLLIMEHHLLRDEAWQQKTSQVYEASRKAGNVVKTAAESVGLENVFLESRRKQLYEEIPPSKEFQKWMNQSSINKGIMKPPI
jgi:predicted metallo-beta-lactamase superfamily hydrolase